MQKAYGAHEHAKVRGWKKGPYAKTRRPRSDGEKGAHTKTRRPRRANEEEIAHAKARRHERGEGSVEENARAKTRRPRNDGEKESHTKTRRPRRANEVEGAHAKARRHEEKKMRLWDWRVHVCACVILHAAESTTRRRESRLPGLAVCAGQ